MPLPTYADGSIDAGKAASLIEELEQALRGVVAAWDEDEADRTGDFWDRMQPAVDQARAALDETPAERPGAVCPYCGCDLREDDDGEPIAHDHTDDSPHLDPALRPRGDY